MSVASPPPPAPRAEGGPGGRTAGPGARVAIPSRRRHSAATCSILTHDDGVEEDRARDIWVDASGVVTCAFTHVFASEGAPLVKVAVENVCPGDWDLGNNTSRSCGWFQYRATSLSGRWSMYD